MNKWECIAFLLPKQNMLVGTVNDSYSLKGVV